MNCIALFKIIKYTIIKDTEKELVKFNAVRITQFVWGRNGKNTVFADKRGFPH